MVTVELLRETVDTPRELEVIFGSPVLAALPRDRNAAQRALIVEKPRPALLKGATVAEASYSSGE
ncbi:MAG: hypothetical protein DMF69_06150 [Acidobacteria bacterium]|nr:MAG: hypothetical protein DMF69_06150 [Acidobacteriota bacterium]